LISQTRTPKQIVELRQRLRDLGAKPCHEDRVLRGWSQAGSYDRPHSPAADFFPLALRNELPAIDTELDVLARLKSEHSVALSPTLSRDAGAPKVGNPLPSKLDVELTQGANVALRAPSNNEGVARLLVELHDGQMVESVLLPRGGLCVSTQVGCAVGCIFCMSGRNGLLRQLGSAEIVAQVVLARKRRAVSKVVFMGMGEPAHNLDNVLEAIQLLGTQGNIGHKNLVLSTVGDLRVFERLMEGLPHKPSPQPSPGEPALSLTLSRKRERGTTIPAVRPALALSLHATDARLRAELLPHAPRIPVEELVERAEEYARATGYPVQYQWTLLDGVNDSDAELARIAQLLSGKYAVMNFIPFNAVDGLAYRRPSAERIAAMVQYLKQRGILAKIRDSAGQEIEGACGQLRARAVQAEAQSIQNTYPA
jgi:23S rRNA (adenine2503-C2)-methyltransferase